MVHVVGTVHDVSDNPDRVEKIIVRAAEPRMHGTTYITEESAQFPVVDGVLDFEVLPGPCVVAFLRHHGATTYEKLLVPDVAEATFRECLEAGNLAEEGDRSALEKVIRQIQDELAKAAPLVDEVRTLHTEVSNDRTAVDGFAKAAKASAAEAATSETNAKGYETTAGDFAAVATTAATEAVDAMGRVTEVVDADYATREYVDNSLAQALRVDTSVGTRVFAGDQMIYGNTGVRSINHLVTGLDSTQRPHHGSYMIREGDAVTLWGVGYTLGELHLTEILPSGFRPPMNHYMSNVGTAANGSKTFLLGHHNQWTRITFSSGVPSEGIHLGIQAKWITLDPWPTSLPGEPA